MLLPRSQTRRNHFKQNIMSRYACREFAPHTLGPSPETSKSCLSPIGSKSTLLYICCLLISATHTDMA